MAKQCAMGHQMEDSWEICPYCQKTGYEGSLKKTRLENEPNKPPQIVRRGTALMSERQPRAPVVGWFVVLNGEQVGEDFRVRDGQNILGSDPSCDVVINDPTVSSKHASLRHKEGKFILSDLDSTNGSFLNEATDPMAREQIKDNDLVRLGEVKLKFKCL
jgi:hypothetical protein